MRSAAKWIWVIVFVTFVGGFLLLDTSGLLGSTALTASTRVAKVNGRDIIYGDWMQRVQTASEQQSNAIGRALTLDETRELEQRVLDQMIIEILLDEEYRRRRITVSADEIRRAAEVIPHPELLQMPDLQTDGRFDMEKYRRFLASPSTRAMGWLQVLENFYRFEIPRRKLLEQVVADVYITDEEMWSKWKEVHDSAQVSFVALTPESAADSTAPAVTDAEIRRHYDENEELYRQTGRAVVSVVVLPRVITAADTAAARARISALRSEIAAGGDSAFAVVARRESDDDRTNMGGGMLPKGVRGQFYGPAFDSVAFALRPGQLSQPVLTGFGFHLIQLVDRKQDTVTMRHLLVEVRQNDSAAVALDRRADSLMSMAGGRAEARYFDEALQKLGLQSTQALAFQGQLLAASGQYIPSVSAWAFSGARPGEISDLYDSDEGFFMARLDSLVEEGVPPLSDLREVIRLRLQREKKLEAMLPQAGRIAARAASTTLEDAAREAGASVQKAPMFTRMSFVQGIGRDNEAIGAAFALASGAVSAPVLTEDAIFILRIDRRVNADRDAWLRQLGVQRQLLTQSLQQEKVQAFVQGLRDKATIVDERKKLNEMGRAADQAAAAAPRR
jgi:peptidyl-prolyl cis-trans isomerase D